MNAQVQTFGTFREFSRRHQLIAKSPAVATPVFSREERAVLQEILDHADSPSRLRVLIAGLIEDEVFEAMFDKDFAFTMKMHWPGAPVGVVFRAWNDWKESTFATVFDFMAGLAAIWVIRENQDSKEPCSAEKNEWLWALARAGMAASERIDQLTDVDFEPRIGESAVAAAVRAMPEVQKALAVCVEQQRPVSLAEVGA